MPKATTAVVSFKTLLAHRFEIVDFQRDYEWEEAKALSLLDYLYQAVAAGENCYLGTICAYKNPDGVLEVVDGQQRMVTLLLAVAAAYQAGGEDTSRLDRVLYDMTGLGDDEPRLSFPHIPGGDLAYEAMCRGTEFVAPSPAELRAMDDTVRTMWKNLSALHEWSSRLVCDVSPKALMDFWMRLNEELSFTLHVLPDRRSAIRYFEAANSNVSPLNPDALIKNLVLSAGDAVGATSVVLQRWNAISGSGKRSQETLPRIHYILNGWYATHDVPIKKDQVFNWVNDNQVRLGLDVDPVGFTTKLAKAASVFDNFDNGKNPAGEFDPWVKLAATNSGRRKIHYPIIAAAHELGKEAFSCMAKRLAGFNFLLSTAKLRGQDAEKYVRAATIGMRTAKTSRGVDKVFGGVIEDLMREHGAAIRHRLESDVLDKQLAASALRMAAVTYEPKLDADVVRALTSHHLEHVYPQVSAATAAGWDGSLDENGQAVVSPAPESLNRLGNLTLLRGSENSSVQDASFSKKRKFYREESLLMTKILGIDDPSEQGVPKAKRALLEEALVSDPPAPWTDQRIADRSKSLTARVLQACGVED